LPKAEVPVIVAEVDFLGQTSPIPLVTLFTPLTTGAFRFTAIGNSPPGFGEGQTLTWTDEQGTHSLGVNPLGNGPGHGDELQFRALADTPIQLQGNFFSVTVPPANFSFVLEQF
jgi:hypothetical protein